MRRIAFVPSCCCARLVFAFAPTAATEARLNRRLFPSTSQRHCGGDYASDAVAPKAQKQRILHVVGAKKKAPAPDAASEHIHKPLITKVRAMQRYGLLPEDLDTLPKHARRSEFLGEPRVIVYCEDDVLKRATEVRGSVEAVRKWQRTRAFAPQPPVEQKSSPPPQRQFDAHDFESSRAVFLIAIGFNACLICAKGYAAWLTGSKVLTADCAMTAADLLNQALLLYGLRDAKRQPDSEHPYGYANLRQITSLMFGVVIMCMPCGTSLFAGTRALISPVQLEPFGYSFYCFFAIAVAQTTPFLLECWVTYKAAAAVNLPFLAYLRKNPSLYALLAEDSASLAGLLCVSLPSLFLSYTLQQPRIDGAATVLLGLTFGAVGVHLIIRNVRHLLGSSMPKVELDACIELLNDDPVVKSTHDVKSTRHGGDKYRLKAEIDFDGAAITRHYLSTVDKDDLLRKTKAVETTEDMEALLVDLGERIVDQAGDEVDRIERNLIVRRARPAAASAAAAVQKANPKLRHVDLEAL